MLIFYPGEIFCVFIFSKYKKHEQIAGCTFCAETEQLSWCVYLCGVWVRKELCSRLIVCVHRVGRVFGPCVYGCLQAVVYRLKCKYLEIRTGHCSASLCLNSQLQARERGMFIDTCLCAALPPLEQKVKPLPLICGKKMRLWFETVIFPTVAPFLGLVGIIICKNAVILFYISRLSIHKLLSY